MSQPLQMMQFFLQKKNSKDYSEWTNALKQLCSRID